jgi:hypothetical protein
MKFSTTTEQDTKIRDWLANDIYPKIIAQERERNPQPSMFMQADWDSGYPYQGVSGGGLTYCFTPTSIGVVETVKYGEYELDISNYDMW